MSNKYVHARTCVYNINYHIVWCVKYRRKVLKPQMCNRLYELVQSIVDEKGFSAPYGLTTAERRHPEFRTRGVGKCEWDGAIWPFASAQTLTAMANFMNNYPQTVLSDSVYFRQM